MSVVGDKELAREALLDALDALGPLADSCIVVGA